MTSSLIGTVATSDCSVAPLVVSGVLLMVPPKVSGCRQRAFLEPWSRPGDHWSFPRAVRGSPRWRSFRVAFLGHHLAQGGGALARRQPLAGRAQRRARRRRPRLAPGAAVGVAEGEGRA